MEITQAELKKHYGHDIAVTIGGPVGLYCFTCKEPILEEYE